MNRRLLGARVSVALLSGVMALAPCGQSPESPFFNIGFMRLLPSARPLCCQLTMSGRQFQRSGNTAAHALDLL